MYLNQKEAHVSMCDALTERVIHAFVKSSPLKWYYGYAFKASFSVCCMTFLNFSQ